MRIELDFNDAAFVTIRRPDDITLPALPTRYRALVVDIDGKKFSVIREVTGFEMYRMNPDAFMDAVDESLRQEMEYVFRKILIAGCNAIPAGMSIHPETELKLKVDDKP